VYESLEFNNSGDLKDRFRDFILMTNGIGFLETVGDGNSLEEERSLPCDKINVKIHFLQSHTV